MAIEKHTTESIVINYFDNGENDRVYKFFTRDYGMIFVHAKSIRKLESKLRSHLLVGRKSLITIVKGREVWRLTGAESVSKKSDFLSETAVLLERFVRGEGAYKKLFDKILEIDDKKDSFDKNKTKILLYYIILVDLGFADANVIGAKSLKEYVSFSVDDLYTHLLLNFSAVKSHLHSVLKEMQF